MNGASGVLAELLERERTGMGTVVRTSLLAAGVSVHAFQGSRWTVGQEVPHAGGNHHPSIAPCGTYRCRDGAVQIAVGSPQQWRRLCEAFDLDAADARFASNDDRVRNRRQLVDVLEAAFAQTDGEPLLAELPLAGVPSGRVRTLDEVYACDQVASQGLKLTVDHARLGEVTLPGPPLRFFGHDEQETTRTEHVAPPVLGADGAAVPAWVARTAAGTARA